VYVDRFHAHIVNAMRQAQHDASPNLVPSISNADELQKLWNLKQNGILTDDEFADQKARILGLPGTKIAGAVGAAVAPPQ